MKIVDRHESILHEIDEAIAGLQVEDSGASNPSSSPAFRKAARLKKEREWLARRWRVSAPSFVESN